MIAYNENLFKKAACCRRTIGLGRRCWPTLKSWPHGDGVQTQWGRCYGPDSYINYNPFIHAFLGKAPFTPTMATVDSPAALGGLVAEPLRALLRARCAGFCLHVAGVAGPRGWALKKSAFTGHAMLGLSGR